MPATPRHTARQPASRAAQATSATRDPRKHVKITTDLRGKLDDGTLTADTTLHMGHLARQWGASRNTIKKALTTLANDGLIRCYPGYGYRVLPAPNATRTRGKDPSR